MKKIINCLKTLVYGILPAISGGLIALDIMYIINNIKSINTGAGWSVVLSFVLALTETILAVCLLYDLGTIQLNSNKWVAHKKEIATQTINDSSTSDNETSDEAADVSSNKKSNSKHKKS